MTDPTAPTDPVTSEPAVLTGAELDRAITDAAREYIAAQRARPRDQQRIDDAKAELDALIALRDQLSSGG